MTGNKEKKKILVILGPTASGKTGLAVELAHKFNGEIVSADSRQVYKGMDIGTSKDLDEYSFEIKNKEGKSETINIPYHMIDIADPEEVFDLARYQIQAFKAIDNILKRGKLPILTGGSGLYLQAIVDNYQLSEVSINKELREELEKKDLLQLTKELKDLDLEMFKSLNESDVKNKRRLIRCIEEVNGDSNVKRKQNNNNESKYNSYIIGLSCPIDILRKRIKQKLDQGLDQGMVKEVKDLNKQGLSWKRLNDLGLEYRYIAKYLQGELEYNKMIEELSIAIGQFAKRQMSWFRRWERQGTKINWFDNAKDSHSKVAYFRHS